MRRADRLFQIVQYLRGGRLLTAYILAERLEVSERTIYRDIADLIGSGVPIEGEAGVGYLMRAGYDLPPLMFSRDEMAALIAGARMVRAFGGAAMALAAEEAMTKIHEVLPQEAKARSLDVAVHAMGPLQDNNPLRKTLDELDHAIETKQRLGFNYTREDGTPSTRIIRPVGLWFWGRVWTLIGWCELRDDFRMFRVDRLADLELCGIFTPAPGQALADFYAQQKHRPYP